MSHHPDPRADRPDEAWERLRAADPAAHLEPHAATLDAAVRARVGDVLPAASAPAGARPVDELAAARARRRPGRWLAVAAVAAGTLAVGSAGYALGDRADGDVVASTSPGAITLPGSGQDGAAGGLAQPEGAARGTEESAAADSMAWYGGRTVFSGQGLSEAGGTAEAWGFDPGRVWDAGTVAQVAAALGLAGEPTLQGGSWTVGATDGTGPNLQLHPDGLASVSFYDPTRDPWGCPTPEPDVAVEGGEEPAVDTPACTAPDLGAAPQGDAAVARGREILAGVGLDPDAFEYEVGDAGIPQAVYVTAHGLLAGQRTGLLWSMTLVGDGGVQSLYGSLAPTVPLGTYEVISPAAAVARLSDPRFGPSGGGPVTIADAEGAARELSVAPDEPVGEPQAAVPPAAPAAGSRFLWPVTEVVLTGARLGLAQHTHPDGTTVLLPAYELTDGSGATWSVVAVTDAALDFAPPVAP